MLDFSPKQSAEKRSDELCEMARSRIDEIKALYLEEM